MKINDLVKSIFKTQPQLDTEHGDHDGTHGDEVSGDRGGAGWPGYGSDPLLKAKAFIITNSKE